MGDAGLGEGCPSRCLLKGGVLRGTVKRKGTWSGLPRPRVRSLEEASRTAKPVVVEYAHKVITEVFGGVGVDEHMLCPLVGKATTSTTLQMTTVISTLPSAGKLWSTSPIPMITFTDKQTVRRQQHGPVWSG